MAWLGDAYHREGIIIIPALHAADPAGDEEIRGGGQGELIVAAFQMKFRIQDRWWGILLLHSYYVLHQDCQLHQYPSPPGMKCMGGLMHCTILSSYPPSPQHQTTPAAGLMSRAVSFTTFLTPSLYTVLCSGNDTVPAKGMQI